MQYRIKARSNLERIKEMPVKYAPGQHPNSQINLELRGRKPDYGEHKKRRFLTVTEEGWQGSKAVADQAGCASISDLIEKLGRGELKLLTPQSCRTTQ